eukprot:c11450_g1_i1 orf=69-1001(-)
MARRRADKEGGNNRALGSGGARAKRSTKARGSEADEATPTKKTKKVSSSPAPVQETRLARFLPKPSASVRERISRAFAHRLYLIDKELSGSPPSSCHFFILGATGNVYTVKLGLVPSCTCPDHAKGNTCKHILFVMLRVLKLPCDDPRVWQKALLTSELHALLHNLSVNDAVLASGIVRQRFKQITGESSTVDIQSSKSVQREIDGDCPICYEPMASSSVKPSEPVVFCKTCGNNVHADCFKRWSQSKKNGRPTCIYCRALWESEAKVEGASSQHEKYINLATYSDAHRPDETSIEALYPESYQWWNRNR